MARPDERILCYKDDDFTQSDSASSPSRAKHQK